MGICEKLPRHRLGQYSGDWVTRFEKQLCDITGARNALAVSNGTVALRLGLHVVGVAPGEEVFVPPLSFVATANAVRQVLYHTS